MDSKKWMIGLGALAVGTGCVTLGAVVGLYIKNSLEQRSIKELTLDQVVRILKLIRKEKYIIYKQTATFAINITRQTRNNINSQMIEQFINGPESPFKIKEEIEKITEQVCKAEDVEVAAYLKSFELFKDEKEVSELVKQQQRDYQITLTGKMPPFNVVIPETLTKEKYLNIQNQITKKSYIQQVAVFKKLSEYSEEMLAQNPHLLSELGNHEKEQEDILIEQGLGSQFDPPFAVYEMAGVKFRSDPTTRMQIAKIEQGYQRILMRYSMKIQNKTITPQELNDMEEEVIFFDPLVV